MPSVSEIRSPFSPASLHRPPHFMPPFFGVATELWPSCRSAFRSIPDGYESLCLPAYVRDFCCCAIYLEFGVSRRLPPMTRSSCLFPRQYCWPRQPIVDALSFAVERPNGAGGLLGRSLNLIKYDTQSNMQLYAQYARQPALRDRAAAVHTGITSASREVVSPVLGRYKPLCFYNNQYEGGLCDSNVFATAVTPGPTVENLASHPKKMGARRSKSSRPTTTTGRSSRPR